MTAAGLKTAHVPLLRIAGKSGLIIDGDWVESKDQDPDGDVRLLQLADIGVGNFLDRSSRFMTSSKARQLKCTYLEKGDILVARMPDPIGRACQFPGSSQQCVTVVDVCVLRPDNDVADPKYVTHILNSQGVINQLDRYVKGATRQRISRKNLEQIPIPLPPLPEQIRIAAILDQVDALRVKRREALAQLDSLTQSIFIEMFGDLSNNPMKFPVHSLGSICDVRDGTHDSPKFVESGFPLVTTKNLKDGTVDLAGASYISAMDYDAINKRSKVDKGDILMPMIGTIGNPVLVENEPAFAIKNVALIKFSSSSPERLFILQILKSSYFERLVMSKNKGGTQKFLSLGDIRSLPIPLPPKPLQDKFRRTMMQLKLVKAKHTDSGAELDTLFASLQHRAFRGEL